MRAPLNIMLAVATMLAGCSNSGADVAKLEAEAGQAAPTQDAATRKEPVVAGRPARVFVFAGVGTKCEPVAAPVVTITAQPAKGDLTLKPGQDTAIAASAAGTCVGAKATGTGVYYTARAGATGTDRFAVQAKLASGELSTRTFEVTIAE